MPTLRVSARQDQDALMEVRRLVAPVDAATRLGISRQAVEKSAGRTGGQLLLWVFETDGERRQREARFVDFGPRAAAEDPSAWRVHRDDPEILLREAVERLMVTRARAAPEGRGVLQDRESLRILHLIASGVIRFAEQVRDGRPVRVPYPEPLQKGLDQLTARCLRLGVSRIPQSVPDLLTWCRTLPLTQWPLDLGEEAVGGEDVLLDGPYPTALCQEWSVDAKDVEADVLEREVMGRVFAACQRSDDQEGYVAFRTLVIRRPVLTALELALECAKPTLGRLADEVREAYQEIPLEWIEGGLVTCCATCDNPLVRTRGGSLRCGDDHCVQFGGSTRGRVIPAREDVLWVRQALRTFVSVPGRAELRLAERLRSLGLEVELWPALDAYDLRITFPDGEVWAVDLKDWASPVALARSLNRNEVLFRDDPPWHRAFFVFPQDRLRRRPDYLRAFLHFARGVGGPSPIQALMEHGFLDAVRRRLAGLTQEAEQVTD